MTIFNDAVIESLLPSLKGRNEGLTFIAQVTLTGSATTIAFSSISQLFTHLFLAGSLRTDRAAENDIALVRFNADSGNNYYWQQLYILDTTPGGAAAVAGSSIQALATEAASSTASAFSPFTISIPNYVDAIYKTLLAQSSRYGNISATSDMLTMLASGRWHNTAAISAITLLPGVGTNFVSGSRVALYGIR